jgi:CheY-like chemotaxis protein
MEISAVVAIRKGHETILLVDDESMILDVTQAMLEGLGYRVLTAPGGAEALEIYRENRENIDLVILDMVMPGMSGGDTFDRLKLINPEIKVILSSGYSLNGMAHGIMQRGARLFLQKPFRLNELSHKIREALDQQESGQ